MQLWFGRLMLFYSSSKMAFFPWSCRLEGISEVIADLFEFLTWTKLLYMLNAISNVIGLRELWWFLYMPVELVWHLSFIGCVPLYLWFLTIQSSGFYWRKCIYWKVWRSRYYRIHVYFWLSYIGTHLSQSFCVSSTSYQNFNVFAFALWEITSSCQRSSFWQIQL